MLRSWIGVVAACIVALAAIAGPAEGGTIYSTFGEGDTYGNYYYQVVGSSVDGAGEQTVGSSFTVSQDATLASLDLALVHQSGTPSLTVKLLGDASGLPDESTVLATWSVTVGSSSIHHLSSLSNVALAAGTTYWVTTHAGATDTIGGWHLNDQGDEGMAGKKRSADPWFTASTSATGAFRVNVVPLPGAVWLGFGLLASLGVARRIRLRRKSL